MDGTLVVAPSGTNATSTATCPTGSVVTGGGFVVVPEPGADIEFFVLEDQRGAGNSWQVTIDPNEQTTFRAVAECATLS
ncbi:hypothetical protein [Streptomyces sp. NPDC058613]|uniref:hypothetical protein n=1 Tax=unclassified Streptomyces TaxID=2593676 RepID=UPI00365E7F20